MLLAAAFALVSQQAQGVAPQDTTRLRDTLRLGTIVIRETAKPNRYATLRSPTATKVNTPLRDTPQAISVITRDVIRDKSMLSMADALRHVPGLTMGHGEGHRDAPTIRGNASTADFFVDGIRDDVQYFRDLYNAESIEALGGSNAMTFGRGGAGGVINRITKRARFESIGDFVLEGGAFDHGRATVDVGGRATQTLALRLNAMLQNSSNFRDAFSNSRLGVSPQATMLLGPKTVARFGAEYVADDRTVDRGLPSFRGVRQARLVRSFLDIRIPATPSRASGTAI